MSIDTENVLAELGSKINRLQTLEYETEKRAKQRIDGFSTWADPPVLAQVSFSGSPTPSL